MFEFIAILTILALKSSTNINHFTNLYKHLWLFFVKSFNNLLAYGSDRREDKSDHQSFQFE